MKTTRIALLVVTALALPACQEAVPPTSPEPSTDPREAVLDALVASYEAGTVHQEFWMDVSAGGQSFAFSGEADFDYDRRRGAMSMDLGVLGGEMDMIVDGTVTYMRSPIFARQVPTEWVKMDLAKIDPEAAAQLGGSAGGIVDPSAYVGLFAGAVEVSEAGEEDVGGVATTRYEGTIDLKRVIERFPAILGEEAGPSTEEALEQTLDQMEALGIDGGIPFEIWIDDEGLPRRQRIAMDFGGVAPGNEDASMEIQVDFSAFGEPIEVDVPKDREVTDVTEALSAAAASGQG
jgi:hypothetical protein